MAKAGQGGREAGKKNILVFSPKSFSSQRKRTEVHFSPPILTRTKLKTYYKDTEGQKGLIGFISVRVLKYAYIGIHVYVHICFCVYTNTYFPVLSAERAQKQGYLMHPGHRASTFLSLMPFPPLTGTRTLQRNG